MGSDKGGHSTTIVFRYVCARSCIPTHTHTDTCKQKYILSEPLKWESWDYKCHRKRDLEFNLWLAVFQKILSWNQYFFGCITGKFNANYLNKYLNEIIIFKSGQYFLLLMEDTCRTHKYEESFFGNSLWFPWVLIIKIINWAIS